MKNEILKDKIFEAIKQQELLTEQKTGTKDFVEMVSLLFHSRTQAHTLHLQTKSFAEHSSGKRRDTAEQTGEKECRVSSEEVAVLCGFRARP